MQQPALLDLKEAREEDREGLRRKHGGINGRIIEVENRRESVRFVSLALVFFFFFFSSPVATLCTAVPLCRRRARFNGTSAAIERNKLNLAAFQRSCRNSSNHAAARSGSLARFQRVRSKHRSSVETIGDTLTGVSFLSSHDPWTRSCAHRETHNPYAFVSRALRVPPRSFQRGRGKFQRGNR